MDTNNPTQPLGGTELMYNELKKRLPDLFDKFSIFNYPSQIIETPLPLIYWNQLSYDQEAVQFLQNPKHVESIDNFVFVSHWQAEQFRQRFNIPGFKTRVIKNAHLGVSQRKRSKPKKVRLCYTSTPWRGLDVLLDAWELVKSEQAELHIFSSTSIYGTEFDKSTTNQYQELFDRCKTTEGVVYRGYVSNEKLRGELHNFDILAYPNTFEETSCISVIEALSAGLRVVTSNLGALPETTEGWAKVYPYLMDKHTHSFHFSKILKAEIEAIKSGKHDKALQQQSRFYGNKWSWETRINEWNDFLEI